MLQKSTYKCTFLLHVHVKLKLQPKSRCRWQWWRFQKESRPATNKRGLQSEYSHQGFARLSPDRTELRGGGNSTCAKMFHSSGSFVMFQWWTLCAVSLCVIFHWVLDMKTRQGLFAFHMIIGQQVSVHSHIYSDSPNVPVSPMCLYWWSTEQDSFTCCVLHQGNLHPANHTERS